MRPRWRLVVVAREPADQESLAYALMKAWGDKPQTFWLRINGLRVAHFYEKVLGLPANFYVVPNSQPLERLDSRVSDEGDQQ